MLFADPDIVVEQQVEVERTRRIAKVSLSTKMSFDGKQRLEQVFGVEGGFECGNGVDEVGLTVDSHRRRAIERRKAQQPEIGLHGEGFTGRPHLQHRIGQVGAKCDEGPVRRTFTNR